MAGHRRLKRSAARESVARDHRGNSLPVVARHRSQCSDYKRARSWSQQLNSQRAADGQTLASRNLQASGKSPIDWRKGGSASRRSNSLSSKAHSGGKPRLRERFARATQFFRLLLSDSNRRSKLRNISPPRMLWKSSSKVWFLVYSAIGCALPRKPIAVKELRKSRGGCTG